MKALLVVLALFLPIINAQVPHWGPCPEPVTQPAFNLKKVTYSATAYAINRSSILLLNVLVVCLSVS